MKKLIDLWWPHLTLACAVVVFLVYGFNQTEAHAQTVTTSNQGKPAVSGATDAWPVGVLPRACTPTQKVTLASSTAAACPSSQVSGRRLILLCNSPENATDVQVKVRVDGVAPVIGIANPGDVLARGDCVAYAITSAHTPQCIAASGSVAVTSLECVY